MKPSFLRVIANVFLGAATAASLTALSPPARAQADEFHRTVATATTLPVILRVELNEADLQIVYARDGLVNVTVTRQTLSGHVTAEACPVSSPAITQQENRVTIQSLHETVCQQARALYRVEVPYRTEVNSVVSDGNLTVMGVMGPVNAIVDHGDIKGSYISKGLVARATSGNLDIEVIGEKVEATTGSGNISCTRVAQGVSAETGDGDIVLMLVGASSANVRKGTGRIEVGGARGNLIASTDAGDLHVKAQPHEDWTLKTVSGKIHLELPPATSFNVDAESNSGELSIRRDDMEKFGGPVQRFHQKVNGGGKDVRLSTVSGEIVIG